VQACVQRLLDLIAYLSPEHNVYRNHPHMNSWRSLPSAVTWAATCTTHTTRHGACLAMRAKAVSLLRDLATAPCTANEVQDALLAAFTRMCTHCSKHKTTQANSGITCAGVAGNASVHAQVHAESTAVRGFLPALAPTLAVGGVLDALFLRANVSEEDVKYASTWVRHDVMDAFLRACDLVFAADWDWGGGMCMLGAMMRTRMIKALWELLTPQVSIYLVCHVSHYVMHVICNAHTHTHTHTHIYIHSYIHTHIPHRRLSRSLTSTRRSW
jgi:hypothetical protein